MKTSVRNLPFGLLIALTSCTPDDSITPGPKTFASGDIFLVSSTDGETYTKGDLTGTITMVYQEGVTTTTINLSNMEPNTSHAMHVQKDVKIP